MKSRRIQSHLQYTVRRGSNCLFSFCFLNFFFQEQYWRHTNLQPDQKEVVITACQILAANKLKNDYPTLVRELLRMHKDEFAALHDGTLKVVECMRSDRFNKQMEEGE